MGIVFISTLEGAAIGAFVAIVLYVLGFGVELINCACSIVMCEFNNGDAIPAMWSSGSFISILVLCMIGGGVIGLFYGLSKAKAARDYEAKKRIDDSSEAARKQRVQWASEVKQKALEVDNICESNYLNTTPLVSGTYDAEKQMELILSELANAAELMGKIDAMAEDVKKGGVSI